MAEKLLSILQYMLFYARVPTPSLEMLLSALLMRSMTPTLELLLLRLSAPFLLTVD